MAPTPTPWVYQAEIYFGYVLPQPNQFSSLSALEGAVEGFWRSHNWCSISLTGIEFDRVPGPWITQGTSPKYANGLDYEHQHRLDYTAFFGNCTYPQNYYADVLQYRTTSTCPFGYGKVYEAGPPVVGPYCAKPWTLIDPGKCPHCQKGGVTKGNPIDIGTGNKRQAETDYRSAGVSPLGFTRYFNSWLAGAYSGGAVPPVRAGLAWSADYFQSIRYFHEGAVATAFVFRPDGERVIFNESGGAFAPNADMDFTLTAQRDSSGVITGWTLKNGSDVTETYDGSGNLLSIAQRNGITQTLQYSNGLPASVTDSFGNQLQFGFTNGLLSSITLPDGGTITYGYDTSSRLTSVTDAASNVRQYHYEVGGAYLTGVTDENLSRFSTFGYDSLKRPISTEHAGGVNKYTVSYSQTWARTVTDPLGTNRSYNIGILWSAMRLTGASSVSAGPGEPKALTYDVNANIASKRDFNNNLTCYAYDLTRNLETVRVEGFAPTVTTCPANLAAYTPASGTRERKITTTWHSTFRLPTSIAEANRTTSFTHDTNGNVLTRTVTDTSVTPNVSRTWTYTYNAFGRVLTEDGPRTDVSDVTTYTYYTCTTGYQCGQLQTVTNALGHVTTYNSYNAHGQPTQITDPNGLVTSLAHDLRQRLTDRCVGGSLPGCSGGELTHLDYWPTGLLKKVTNPDGSYIQYDYDAAHRLTQVSDGTGAKVVYTLDNMGNRTAENTYDPSNALRRTHSRVFNTLNQLWKDVNAAGTAAVTTTFGYDTNGNQTSVAAPLARNSSSLYDELNRLKQITDPAAGITQFGYDANDNLTQVTDPRSLATSYAYTGFGDLKTQTSPDTGATTNTYDSGGNLATSTDSRGAVTTYGYDAANRVTSAAFTLGGVTDQTITYNYDTGTNQNGRLTGASDATHSLTWGYDSRGRVTSKSQTVGGVALAMSYGYNAAGQLSSMTLPSGSVVGFGYNANNQVTSVTLNGSTTILSGVTYDPFGPITGWTWGNGTTASRGFDTDGKITQVDNANGQSLKNYGYDNAFRITSITDAADPTLSWTYGYDSLDRLNSASKTGFTQGFTYDANGNRLSETGSAPSTYTNSTTSNRLSSISGSLPRSYSYDTAGNTLSFAGATFSYNNRGRMASATNGGTTATYTYNALGQRIRRTTSSTTTLYSYDEAGHLAGEYTAAGALVQETVWLGDIPVATIRPNGAGGMDLFYVHADHLNTPRLITDTANNIRWRWDSDPYGTTPPNQNPSGLGTFEYSLRFPGQQYDAVVGLHYNYFRDYDPATGRYAESDPIGLWGGLNSYAYVMNRPSMLLDPSGLLSLTVAASWTQSDDLVKGLLGVTFASIRNVRCTCECSGGEWKLSGCSAFLYIEAFLRDHYESKRQEAFARWGEGQHVQDYKDAAGRIRRHGEEEEATQKYRRFSSKGECEKSTASFVEYALNGERIEVYQETLDRDRSGEHTYRE